MAEEKDELESENQADGAETDVTKTSEEDSKDFKQMFEDQRKRAEKAEALLKVKKSESDKPDNAPPKQSINAQADPDELRLIAKGLSDAEIEQLHVISKGKSITLMESLKDPLFKSFQKDFQEQEKKEQAKLGASNGSSQGDSEQSEFKQGMTAEEHKVAWEKSLGKK